MARRIKMVKYLDLCPPSDHDIRPADKDHLQEIARLMQGAYVDTPDYEGETLEDTVKEVSMVFRGYYGAILPDASLAVFDEEGAIASCLFVCNFKGEPTITYLFTRRDSQCRGYASSLIHAAENALASLGYDRIYLYVSEGNRAAVSLYLKLGFVEIPLNSSPVDREFLNEVRERELSFIPMEDEEKLARVISQEFGPRR